MKKTFFFSRKGFVFYYESEKKADSEKSKKWGFKRIVDVASADYSPDDHDEDRSVIGFYNLAAKKDRQFEGNSKDDMAEQVRKHFDKQSEPVQDSTPVQPTRDAKPQKSFWKAVIFPAAMVAIKLMDFLTDIMGLVLDLPDFVEKLQSLFMLV